MRVGPVASSIAHAAVLALALVSFSAPRPFDAQPDAIPVEVVNLSDVTKITKGAEKGKKNEPPKTVAEKVDVDKPTPDPTLKVSPKEEVAPTQASAPPPPTPEPKPEPKPDPKPPQPQPKAEPPPKADEALKPQAKVEEAKPNPPPLPVKKPEPPKEPPKPQTDAKTQQNSQKFDADRIAALLDKRQPQRQVATGSAVSNIASLGGPRGDASALSMTEMDAFREKVKQCWKMPQVSDDKIYVYILLKLNRDGTLAQPPVVTDGLMNPSQKAMFDAFALSAQRALLQCQPYTMFKQDHYETWKELEPRFFPNMFGG